VYLLEERKLAKGTVVLHISALRFFYVRMLKRRNMKEDLLYPKKQRRVACSAEPGRSGCLIDSAKNLFHRAMLMTMYATGLRRSALCRLKVRNIGTEPILIAQRRYMSQSTK